MRPPHFSFNNLGEITYEDRPSHLTFGAESKEFSFDPKNGRDVSSELVKEEELDFLNTKSESSYFELHVLDSERSEYVFNNECSNVTPK